LVFDVTLWKTNIAIENGHRNSGFYPVKMVIFHSFLYVYQRINNVQSLVVDLLFQIGHGEFRIFAGYPGCQTGPICGFLYFNGQILHVLHFSSYF
jgi:hypothetical protein